MIKDGYVLFEKCKSNEKENIQFIGAYDSLNKAQQSMYRWRDINRDINDFFVLGNDIQIESTSYHVSISKKNNPDKSILLQIAKVPLFLS